MGQAKLRKLANAPPRQKKQEQVQTNLVDQYLARRLLQPGYFARTGWQAWQFLAMNSPENFPVQLRTFLDTCASKLLLPSCHSSLDMILYTHYKVHGERLLPCFLDQHDKTAEELRELKWRNLTSSMNIFLTQAILNYVNTTTRKVQLSKV